jgi:hypothetical protein
MTAKSKKRHQSERSGGMAARKKHGASWHRWHQQWRASRLAALAQRRLNSSGKQRLAAGEKWRHEKIESEKWRGARQANGKSGGIAKMAAAAKLAKMALEKAASEITAKAAAIGGARGINQRGESGGSIESGEEDNGGGISKNGEKRRRKRRSKQASGVAARRAWAASKKHQ